MYFYCIKCGLCCQYSYLIPELKMLQNEYNVCRNFDEKTKKCRIYQSRPLICNIDEMYNQKYSHQMTKKEYYLANLEVCYKLNFMANNKENMKEIRSIINDIKNFEQI